MVWMHMGHPSVSGCGGAYPVYIPAIGGRSSSDIWVAGGDFGLSAGPYFLHWDGSAWSYNPSNFATEIWMRGIVEFSPTDVYFAGQYGVYHWDGSAWSTVLTPVAGETFTNILYLGASLYVPSYKVGFQAPVDQRFYYATPGGAWSVLDHLGGDGYYGEYALAATLDHVYTAYQAPHVFVPTGYIAKFDLGTTSRSIQQIISFEHFTPLYVAASDPVWLLFYEQLSGNVVRNPTEFPNPPILEFSTGGVGGISWNCGGGIGTTNVWVGGTRSGDPSMMYWNGAVWIETVPVGWGSAHSCPHAVIFGITVFSPTDVWAVGRYTCITLGHPDTTWIFVMHWDGATWTHVL